MLKSLIWAVTPIIRAKKLNNTFDVAMKCKGDTLSEKISYIKTILIDNKYARHIGYKPKDNAEGYRNRIDQKNGFINSRDSLVRTHGGNFVSAGHFDDN